VAFPAGQEIFLFTEVARLSLGYPQPHI